MNLLVTAGNTQVLIDRVRCLTNIFTGRTGTGIALHAHARGHAVTLLTSHPQVVAELGADPEALAARWRVLPYRTFEDLQRLMGEQLRGRPFDAVIHSAAVSDYRAGGIYAPRAGTRFRPDGGWEADAGAPALDDRAAGKVKSDEPELWLRLLRAPKLIDAVRGAWGFGGLLVKFKLEVGVGEARLLEIAERSRVQSAADLMVANTLEDAGSHAFLGPLRGVYEQVRRRDLPARLLDTLASSHEGRRHD